MKQILVLSTILFLTIGCQSKMEEQAIKPGEHWFDNNGVHINAHGGGILYHDKTYYWFGEHKTEGAGGNKANVGVHCYSSKNLGSWTDEGIALNVVENDESHDITKGCVLERPKVIYNEKTGKFVMWFHLELKGQGYDAARTGLAVAEKVTGPYKFEKSLRPNAGIWPSNMSDEQKQKDHDFGSLKAWSEPWRKAVREGAFVQRDFQGGQMSRDMTLFVDDDGKGYHIAAAENNQTLHVRELTDDYLDFTGKYARVFPGNANEAPAIFKKDGMYYMISSGCTGWKPNPGRSARAKHIMGPWEELGNPCRGDSMQVAKTFFSQSTYVIPVAGKKDAFIYMGDRWTPKNAIDGRYIWLPIEFEDDRPVLKWKDSWKLSDYFK